ncbi:MAG: AroM family protein [Armatimonadota bacterium]|nr:AroM family protein [Armatimonadota bacterium]MDR7534012.1 AroM family protein [Armatimonadota bacterium]MDR7536543.1 AroM family protein [Armatimonadota bacterium]
MMGPLAQTATAAATVAAITIGQSPRPDIMDEVVPLLPSRVRVVQTGALDGLSLAEVAAMRPEPGDHTLVTRLRSGEEVLIGMQRVAPRVQACIDAVQDAADLIVVLCTGTFPQLRSRRPVIYPEHLLLQVTRAVSPGAHVGVLTPAAAQIPHQEQRWGMVASAVTVRAYAPYATRESVEEACAAFATAGVDLVVLDCLGYTVALKDTVRRLVGRPALLARTLLARAVAELLG